MINTQVRNSINVSSNKTDLKDVVGKQNQSDNTKDALALALKKNLGLIQQGTNPSQLPLNDTQELNLKLKSLINKFLDQLHSQGSTSDKFIKQGSALNFAPNFSNELKFLASEMQKSDIFKDVLVKLEQILKPASETKTSNLAMLFKNSGVFFEAKLKDALSPELLPKSFHSLVNTIKSVSSDKIANEIIALANKELDPKSSLSELKNIIQNEQNINKEVIKNSSFKALLELGSKLENFKKYISKNPSLAQEKIQNLASKILTDLNKLEPKLKAEINKLENLALKDTSFLKNLNQSFLSLKENLKNILNPTPQNKNPSNNNTPQTNTVNIKTQEKEHTNPFFSKNTNNDNKTSQKLEPSSVEAKNDSILKNELKDEKIETTKDKIEADKEVDIKENSNKNSQESTKVEANELKNDDNNTDKNSQTKIENTDVKEEEQIKQSENKEAGDVEESKQEVSKENKEEISKDSKEEILDEKQQDNKTSTKNDKEIKLDENKSKNTANLNDVKDDIKKDSIKTDNVNVKDDEAVQNKDLKANSQSQNTAKETSQNPQQQIQQKQETVKNLIFANEKMQMKELENLNQDINKLIKRVNEGLKQLDSSSFEAKLNINDIKNIEHKIKEAVKDLAKITVKNNDDIANELRNDIKSTLLQTASLAKANDNEAVANQANRLLAQIEINQLLSLANDSINTHIPFFWEDLNESKVIFKRGKKDKYFAQIKLNFAKLGELDVLISLNNEKYIDINIMAENKEFRKTIYENAHELKRALNKVGLLSSNFFVGDIIRSKFDTVSVKNRAYDFEMGIDKKA